MTEHDIQNAIRLELSKRGYLTERINVGAGFLIPKNLMDRLKAHCPELRAELEKVPYFTTGAAKGRSDLSAIKDGKIAFLEVKDEKGRTSPEQVTFINAVRDRYGCRAGVVRSVEDALHVVEEPVGEWQDVGSLSCRCSDCGCKNNRQTPFCPNCGKPKRIKEEENE